MTAHDDLRERLEAEAHDCDEAAQAAYQMNKDHDAEFLEDTAKELREAAARLGERDRLVGAVRRWLDGPWPMTGTTEVREALNAIPSPPESTNG